MSLLSTLRGRPAPSPGDRRPVPRRAPGAARPDAAAAEAEARARAFGIVPGTVVDAQGRPMDPPPGMIVPLIGNIVIFAANFAPRGWAFCHGQLLQISTNQSLYSILGTTYGGDGRTSFALPDFRGRGPLHPGEGPGLPSYALGEKGGTETNTLTVNNLAAHNHNPQIHGGAGTSLSPIGNAMSVAPAGSLIYGNAPQGAQTMAPTTLTGGGLPFSNQSPFLAINFIIALQGLFPSRN